MVFAIHRRVPCPRTEIGRSAHLIAVVRCQDVALAFLELGGEPSHAASLGGPEEVRISLCGIRHPLGVIVAHSAPVAPKVWVEGSINNPEGTLLDTVVSLQGTVLLRWIPSRAARLGCGEEVVLRGEVHPHGIVSSEPTIRSRHVRVEVAF